ncbi:hypothetical protein J3B02_000731 [Coemansia erecta]|uniref:Uncharacterized protein n=1 Tax=Coemansia asiatica TaxID=1052880 RepID=A0A9W7XRT6_9FUNG|nr:hypothetical protein LPJ64_000257 [Coemansia asiatica]KAJ2857829.1 hypothetical protein J3B02_000731 [Coemansia erecta]KAJ2886470.1 hypothetical protein FB639_001569 [Coemansia asiatica]
MFGILKTPVSKILIRPLISKPSAILQRSFITQVPRVSSMSSVTSTLEHDAPATFAGDVTFNEDIAMERFQEKAIAADSMHAAANFGENRVVASSSQNVFVYGQ